MSALVALMACRTLLQTIVALSAEPPVRLVADQALTRIDLALQSTRDKEAKRKRMSRGHRGTSRDIAGQETQGNAGGVGGGVFSDLRSDSEIHSPSGKVGESEGEGPADIAGHVAVVPERPAVDLAPLPTWASEIAGAVMANTGEHFDVEMRWTTFQTLGRGISRGAWQHSCSLAAADARKERQRPRGLYAVRPAPDPYIEEPEGLRKDARERAEALEFLRRRDALRAKREAGGRS